VIVYSGIIVVIGMPLLLAVFKEWYKFWMLLGVYTLFAIWIALIKPYPYLGCILVPMAFVLLAKAIYGENF
jgi:hypothetical protein